MILFLLLLCILAAAALGGAYYAYRVAFYAPEIREEKPSKPAGPGYDPYREEMRRIYHALEDRPCEMVSILSHDGLRLWGRYYHVKDGAPLDMGFHGYRSSPLTDFSGGSELSFEMEHNLLLIHQRAHGPSEGRTISFGIREREDVLSWADWASEHFGPETDIFLYGVSMGGASVLMASELDLPGNVRGIVADCPFASPIDIILDVAQKQKLPFPGWLVRPFAILGAKIFGGFDLTETDARRALKNARVPVLIIHGEADGYVPCQMSDLQSCNPEKISRVTVPGADHGISYLVDRPGYARQVREFLQRALRA